jgi:hypothetical protein
MTSMKLLLPASLLAMIALGAVVTSGDDSAGRLKERGHYLVHQVAVCVDCHSPRGPDGQFIAGRHLTGSPLPFKPTVDMPWAPAAPPIAGLPGYTEEAAIEFLTTGKRPHRLPPPRPPMPEYRLIREDASAVVAYLKSLALVPPQDS